MPSDSSRPRPRGGRSYFRATTVAILFILAAAIAVLFIADVTYIDAESMAKELRDANVWDAFFLSLITSIITAILCVVVAIPAGYALSRYRFRGMIVLDVLIDALIVLPVLVIGISLLVAWRQGADSSIPLMGKFFVWLGNVFIYKVPGIILAQFFCSVSYGVRVMQATFDELDPRAEQVAMTLGCSRAGAFWRVALPMARHGIIAAAVLCWARAVGLFGPVQIIGGAVAGKTDVLSVSIFKEISVGQLKPALALSIIMIVMAFIVLLALKTFSRSSLFGSGAGR